MKPEFCLLPIELQHDTCELQLWRCQATTMKNKGRKNKKIKKNKRRQNWGETGVLTHLLGFFTQKTQKHKTELQTNNYGDYNYHPPIFSV